MTPTGKGKGKGTAGRRLDGRDQLGHSLLDDTPEERLIARCKELRWALLDCARELEAVWDALGQVNPNCFVVRARRIAGNDAIRDAAAPLLSFALTSLSNALHTMVNGGMDYPGHKATVGQFKQKLRALRDEAEAAIKAAEGGE